MKVASSFVALAAVLASPSALAQATPAGPATPAALPDGPAPATAAPDDASGCRLAENEGVAPGDAQTATRLLCSEILQAGAPSGARYRVSFGTLGTLLIVTVDREGDGPRSVADSRSMTLHGIEEIRIAAPRIAESIVHGSPLAETQTVDNVVSEEARVPLSRPAKLHAAMGLAGAFTPFNGLAVAPALVLDMHYEANQMEIAGSIRMSAPSTLASQASSETPSTTGGFASASVGTRYFTGNKDVSPYLGGGLAYAYYRVALPNGFDGNASGLDVYVDAGVEILRTHRSRLALGARFDLPFFALNDQPNLWPQPGAEKPQRTLYFAPLSVEARFTF